MIGIFTLFSYYQRHGEQGTEGKCAPPTFNNGGTAPSIVVCDLMMTTKGRRNSNVSGNSPNKTCKQPDLNHKGSQTYWYRACNDSVSFINSLYIFASAVSKDDILMAANTVHWTQTEPHKKRWEEQDVFPWRQRQKPNWICRSSTQLLLPQNSHLYTHKSVRNHHLHCHFTFSSSPCISQNSITNESVSYVHFYSPLKQYIWFG